MASNRPAAVLIVNPNAGRLPGSVRQEVIDVLRARFRLEAFATTARDTGITMASDAASSGARLVIAFGGDGHVNEVVNGLAGTASALGIVPGGTMNVFARSLGVPTDPLSAVDFLVSSLEREPRWVSLGRMDERYFTFSAGCGFDAEAAERVERYVPSKRRFGEVFFYWSAFRVLAGTYRHRNPSMILRGAFGELPVSMAVACNTGPYAYFGNRPVQLAPDVELDKGIDIFALRSMRIESLPFYFWRVAVSGDLVNHPDVFYASDLDGFELHAPEPFSRHVDGEPIAPSTHARFTIEKDVLKVRA